jgi:hypothetical protein
MQHRASTDFWTRYRELPANIRGRADKQFALIKDNPQHPSLQFKKLGDRRGQEIWSARVPLKHRDLAIMRRDAFLWFWIGDHETYDLMIS